MKLLEEWYKKYMGNQSPFADGPTPEEVFRAGMLAAADLIITDSPLTTAGEYQRINADKIRRKAEE